MHSVYLEIYAYIPLCGSKAIRVQTGTNLIVSQVCKSSYEYNVFSCVQR